MARKRDTRPAYPFALPFTPKAVTVTTWVLQTRTPGGLVDVSTDRSTVDRLIEAGCSWVYLYRPRQGPPHTVVVSTDSLAAADARFLPLQLR